MEGIEKDTFKQRNNHVDSELVYLKKGLDENSRITRELHDQVFQLHGKISELPLKVKESVMGAIDHKFVTKDRFSPIEKITYGIITFILLGVLSTVGAAIVFFLRNAQ
jgi:hypothetical protein